MKLNVRKSRAISYKHSVHQNDLKNKYEVVAKIAAKERFQYVEGFVAFKDGDEMQVLEHVWMVDRDNIIDVYWYDEQKVYKKVFAANMNVLQQHGDDFPINYYYVSASTFHTNRLMAIAEAEGLYNE
jgi:hypothetical protein